MAGRYPPQRTSGLHVEPPASAGGRGSPRRSAGQAVPGAASATNTMRLAADDVQSTVISGCGHYCLEEAPQRILATLTAFLASYREST